MLLVLSTQGLQCWTLDLQHLAVARSALLSRPAIGKCADWSLGELGWFDQCSWLLSTPRLAVWTLVDLQPCQVTALLGNKLETCSVSAAWAGQCSVGAWSGWQALQICNILQWPDLFCNQDLQLEPCADWCSWAASGQ